MRRAKEQAVFLLGFVAALWLIELVDQLVFHQTLDRNGIRPRSANGLPGILVAPFLHGGIGHLLANSAPLLVLGWLVLLRGMAVFLTVSAIAIVVGGLGVWLFASPNTIHIGASGLIFGYLGYLLLRGYFERSVASILVAVVVGVLYGGALWSVLPSRPGISWEGHLFGFLAGALAARLLTNRQRAARRPRGI